MVTIMGALSLFTWFVFIFWGHGIIDLMAGKEFMDAYAVTVWYLLANAIAITTLPFAPMILAMGKANLSFWIQFLPTLVYFPVLYWMLAIWHLEGAGYAYIVYHGLRAVLQAFVVRDLSRTIPRSPEPEATLVRTEEDPSSVVE